MYDYDVALSFAGENRDVADVLADAVKKQGYRVFYDQFETAALWGKDLTEELPRKYRASLFCVMLISDQYLDKMWTRFERQTIIANFLKVRGRDYLLPVRLDGCIEEVPGLSELVAFVEIDSVLEVNRLTELLLQVLASRLSTNG